MFHMLSCFDLVAGEDIEAFRSAYIEFVAYMKSENLLEHSGSIGRRRSDTPMDTDDERNHEYYVLMSFKDRAQVDAAYAYIKRHIEPGETSHLGVYKKVQHPVFVCWQDLS
jgi:hypothetical protein